MRLRSRIVGSMECGESLGNLVTLSAPSAFRSRPRGQVSSRRKPESCLRGSASEDRGAQSYFAQLDIWGRGLRKSKTLETLFPSYEVRAQWAVCRGPASSNAYSSTKPGSIIAGMCRGNPLLCVSEDCQCIGRTRDTPCSVQR